MYIMYVVRRHIFLDRVCYKHISLRSWYIYYIFNL